MGTIPNQIVYQLPGTTIDTALMSSALHHETAHALLERIDASDRPQDYLVKGERVALNNKYRELCSDIRSLAIQENTKQNIIAASALKSLITKVPDWKSEIEPIINGLDENHFDLMQPTQGEAEAWEAKVQECQVDNPWRILVSKLFKEGQSQEDLELNQKYVDMYYEQLTDDWLLPLNTRTLYRVLKESTYIGNGKQASQLGHPVDSAQEIMASAINIATKFPEAMAIELQKLPKQESKLIYDLLKLVSDDIIQIHKNDLRFVQYINTQVSKVLNSQS